MTTTKSKALRRQTRLPSSAWRRTERAPCRRSPWWGLEPARAVRGEGAAREEALRGGKARKTFLDLVKKKKVRGLVEKLFFAFFPKFLTFFHFFLSSFSLSLFLPLARLRRCAASCRGSQRKCPRHGGRVVQLLMPRRSSKGTRGRRGGRRRREPRPSSSSPPHLPLLRARPTSSWASRARPRRQMSRPRTARWP